MDPTNWNDKRKWRYERCIQWVIFRILMRHTICIKAIRIGKWCVEYTYIENQITFILSKSSSTMFECHVYKMCRMIWLFRRIWFIQINLLVWFSFFPPATSYMTIAFILSIRSKLEEKMNGKMNDMKSMHFNHNYVAVMKDETIQVDLVDKTNGVLR